MDLHPIRCLLGSSSFSLLTPLDGSLLELQLFGAPELPTFSQLLHPSPMSRKGRLSTVQSFSAPGDLTPRHRGANLQICSPDACPELGRLGDAALVQETTSPNHHIASGRLQAASSIQNSLQLAKRPRGCVQIPSQPVLSSTAHEDFNLAQATQPIVRAQCINSRRKPLLKTAGTGCTKDFKRCSVSRSARAMVRFRTGRQ